MRKFYIVSGEYSRVVLDYTIWGAIQKCLSNDSIGGREIDGHYFYIDERGFRTDSAQWKVPVELVFPDLMDGDEMSDSEYESQTFNDEDFSNE